MLSSIPWYSVVFYGPIYQFVYPADGTSVSLSLFNYYKSRCYEPLRAAVYGDVCAHFFRVDNRSGISQSRGKLMFNFLRNCQVFRPRGPHSALVSSLENNVDTDKDGGEAK